MRKPVCIGCLTLGLAIIAVGCGPSQTPEAKAAQDLIKIKKEMAEGWEKVSSKEDYKKWEKKYNILHAKRLAAENDARTLEADKQQMIFKNPEAIEVDQRLRAAEEKAQEYRPTKEDEEK